MLRHRGEQNKKRMIQNSRRPSTTMKAMATAAAAVSLAHSSSSNKSYHVAATSTAVDTPNTDIDGRSLLSLSATGDTAMPASDSQTAVHMFDIKAKDDPLLIKGIDINLATSSATPIEIYSKVGSYKGSESQSNNWTLIKSTTVFASNNGSTSINFPSIINLASNEKRSFYIKCASINSKCLSYDSNGQTTKRYQDTHLILFGDGLTKQSSTWNSISSNTPHLFSGPISYDLITPQPTKLPTKFPTLQPTNTPTLRPTSSPTPAPSKSPVVIETITTQFDSSHSYAGCMFNILARDHLVITNLAFNTHVTTSMNVQVYTREGSYVNFDKTLNGWTKIVETQVMGKGLDRPTYLPAGSFDPLLVDDKSIQSFYITSTEGPYMRESKGVGISSETGELNTSTETPAMTTWNSDMIIYEGIGKRLPVTESSFSPRVWNGLFEYYTTTAAPSQSPTPMPTSNDFRLRLYWQRGYWWQESSRETYWCMECSGQCREGEAVDVEWCGGRRQQQWNVVGNTIRPAMNPNLCLTLTGYDSENRPLRLQQCKETISRGGIDANEINEQTFVGLNFKEEKFELHPKGDDSWCMTQAHHPKPRERVFLQQCFRSRQHDTSLWEIH